MRRSWKALIVAAAVLLGTVGVMSLATASQGQDTTLALTSETIQSIELDLGETGFSQGDQLVFTDQLFMQGKMVGPCSLWNHFGAHPLRSPGAPEPTGTPAAKAP
jgi:hypothetical protein